MCPLDIEEYFNYTPTPVFVVKGKPYCVRTHFGKAVVQADQLLNSAWRLAVLQNMVQHIKLDQTLQQRARACPDARYWVHSVRFNTSAFCNAYGCVFYGALWRAALVTP